MASRRTTPLKPRPLTNRQRRFVAEYAVDMNATRAAKAAGYSEKTAQVTGSQLLDDRYFPQVAAEVRRHLETQRDDCGIRRQDLIRELLGIARFNPQQMLRADGTLETNLRLLPPEVASAIKQIDVKYSEETDEEGGFVQVKSVSLRFHDKISAVSKIGQLLGYLDKDGNRVAVNFMQVNWEEMFRQRTIEEVLADDPINREIAALDNGTSPPPALLDTTATSTTTDDASERARLEREVAELRARLKNSPTNGHGHHG
jgi:phage terminase small subunit